MQPFLFNYIYSFTELPHLEFLLWITIEKSAKELERTDIYL